MIVQLDNAIKAVCPIDGISIGRKDNKATWRIDFKDEATPEQRTAAQAVMDAFVWDEKQQPQPTIADLVAILTPEQKATLDARISK